MGQRARAAARPLARATTDQKNAALFALADQLMADRARVTELLALDEYVDMIIPRGGAGLHRFCREHSRIPVIMGGIGICHLFVDESADLDTALNVIYNAKSSGRRSVMRWIPRWSIAPSPPNFSLAW